MAKDPSARDKSAGRADGLNLPGDGDHLPLYGMRLQPDEDQNSRAAPAKDDASEPRSGPDQAAYLRSGYGGYGGGQDAGDAAAGDATTGGIEAFEDENRVREARDPTPRTLPTGLDADAVPGTAATKPPTARK